MIHENSEVSVCTICGNHASCTVDTKSDNTPIVEVAGELEEDPVTVLSVVPDGVTSFLKKTSWNTASGEVHRPWDWPPNRELNSNEVVGMKSLRSLDRDRNSSCHIQSCCCEGDGVGCCENS